MQQMSESDGLLFQFLIICETAIYKCYHIIRLINNPPKKPKYASIPFRNGKSQIFKTPSGFKDSSQNKKEQVFCTKVREISNFVYYLPKSKYDVRNTTFCHV